MQAVERSLASVSEWAVPHVDVERQGPRDLTTLAQEWDDLVDRSADRSPWQRPGWALAWWRAFGRGSLRIWTMRRNGRLVALAPLAHAGGGLRSPTNYHSPAFGIVAEDDATARSLLDEVLGSGPRQLCLRFVPRQGATAAAALAAATHHGYRVLERTLERSPYIDTTGDWKTYLAGLDGKLRRELRRRRRKLEERGRVELTVGDGREHLDRLLAECFRVEALGTKGRRGTAIASDPSTSGFYRDVARWAAGRGILRVARLRLDGRAVAVDLALEEGGRHHLLKTGYDPALRTLAPGLLLRAGMIERAFATGLRSYEFLGADEPWKLEWTAATRELLDLRAFRATPAGVAGWLVTARLRPLAVRAAGLMGR